MVRRVTRIGNHRGRTSTCLSFARGNLKMQREDSRRRRVGNRGRKNTWLNGSVCSRETARHSRVMRRDGKGVTDDGRVALGSPDRIDGAMRWAARRPHNDMPRP